MNVSPILAIALLSTATFAGEISEFNLQNQLIGAACNVNAGEHRAASLSVPAASRNELYLLSLIR